MKYKMNVVIADPNTEKGMTSDLHLELLATFAKHPNQYGNGTMLSIQSSDNHFNNLYDIRYDTEYHSDKQVEYLEKWAHDYWSGKDGAYIVKKLTITEAK